MYHPIRLKTTLRLILLFIAFACFGLAPVAHAVSPPPDGGYAGFNTAEGTNALFNLSSGVQNTALGYQALFHNTTGNLNTGIGFRSLFFNSTGVQNTAAGINALSINTTGSFNTAFGVNCLAKSTTGDSSTAVGVQALFSNTTGDENTAVGTGALLSNTTGGSNTATGAFALTNSTGVENTAVGRHALLNSTTGNDNTAVGLLALSTNVDGASNTAVGAAALRENVSGSDNQAFGRGALRNTTGSNNIGIGREAGANQTAGDNVISIGAPGDSIAFTASNRCFIGNIRGVTVGNLDGINVIVDSDGQLGTSNSSRRFKKDIKPMERTSEAILALKPVTFHYKDADTKKAENTPQFGLIAEEVAEVNPDLVVRDADGKPFTVRYDAVNAMLLNEFVKEHRKVEKLEATVASLMAMVTEQAAQIQKVSARLDVSNAAPRVVANP